MGYLRHTITCLASSQREPRRSHFFFRLLHRISCLLLIILYFYFFRFSRTKEVKRCWKCQIETSVRVRMQASTMWFFPEDDLMYEISCNEQTHSGPTVRRSWKVRGNEYLGLSQTKDIWISYRDSSDVRKLNA